MQKILPMIQCYIITQGYKCQVRCLLDSASVISLIRRKICKCLGIQGQPTKLSLSVAGGNSTSVTSETVVEIQLQSLDESYISPVFVAYTTKHVTKDIPPVTLDITQYSHLQNIQFTEDYPQVSSSVIDVIVDSTLFFQLTGQTKASLYPEPLSSNISPRPAAYGQMEDSAETPLGTPEVLNTKLGPVLIGTYYSSTNAPTHTSSFPQYSVVSNHIPDVIIPDYQAFMKLENLGVTETDSDISVEDEKTIKLMEDLTTYNETTQRYTTGLLWKYDKNEFLDNNFGPAKAITLSAKRKSIQQGLEQDVNDAYTEQLKAGFCEEIPYLERKPNHLTHVIPTIPIIRPDAITTRIRICFHASHVTKKGKSLNECLRQGPCFLPNLVEILLNFRSYSNCAVLDISKLFWALWIRSKEDQDVLRFLWQFKQDGPVKIFRATCLPFGLKSSPFMVNWTILHHCERMKNRFPNAARTLKHFLYVDDCSILENDKEKAIQTTKEIYDFFKTASMEPHKFQSSDPDILAKADIPRHLWSQEEIHKVLGVFWHVKEDSIVFDFSKVCEEVKIECKRSLISQASRLFDPHGLLGPCILVPKLLFKQCWEAKLTWDQPLPNSILEPWVLWKKELTEMQNLKVPRLAMDPTKPATLVVFCDASFSAFGTVCYLLQGKSCNLIFSKTRVSPSKFIKKDTPKLTIARLETLAGLVGVRTADFIRKALGSKINKTLFFSDSKILLYRLKKEAETFSTWLSNRIFEIKERSKDDTWHFAPGATNPADLTSRSCGIKDLLNNKIWWNGPSFLTTDESLWPTTRLTREEALLMEEVDSKEQKKEKILKTAEKGPTRPSGPLEPGTASAAGKIPLLSAMPAEVPAAAALAENVQCTAVPAICKSTYPGLMRLIHLTSTWNRMLHSLIYVFRFLVKKFPKLLILFPWLEVFDKAPAYFTVGELREGTLKWIKFAQMLAYGPKVYVIVSKSNLVQLKKDPDTAELALKLPFLDDRGVMRANTRLRLSETISFQTSHPIILPKANIIVERYILYVHKSLVHCHHVVALYYLRRQYLISKREVSRCIRKCQNNFCNKPKLIQQQMAPLPSERLDGATCWESCACDYLGPLYVLHTCKEPQCPHSKAEIKTYALLFSDFLSRGCHIELCEDLSTKAFILAYQRFTARRGAVRMIWSDNFRTFSAGERELARLYKLLDWDEIAQSASKKGVTFSWRHPPPRAPWTSGLVESQVKLVKRLLYAQLQKSKVSARVLESCLLEIEGTLNERPLSVIAEDGEVPLPVTPNTLMYGHPLHLLPIDTAKLAQNVPLNTLQAKRAQILSHFWNKFYKEYMMSLSVSRHSNPTGHIPLEVGQIVLVQIEKPKRNEWCFGKIESIELGRDQKARKCLLTTKMGQIQRHVNSLAFLPGTLEDFAKPQDTEQQ